MDDLSAHEKVININGHYENTNKTIVICHCMPTEITKMS